MIYVLALHDNFPRGMERIILRNTGKSYQCFEYAHNKWVDGTDKWFAHCMNTNDYELISETEAAEIIEKNGGIFAK